MTERYTYQHLKAITSIFGIYLFAHFVYLIYFAQELFSDVGMFPGKLSPTYGYFPNVLNFFTQPPFATIFLIGLTLLSVLVIAGVEKKWLFLALWFGWACLLNRNPLIRNPGMPYVWWMILVFSVIYPIKNRTEYRLDKWLFIGAWSLLAFGYTMSGLDKMQSPSWLNGSAISHLLENPLARDFWITDLIGQQKWLHPVLTYSSLAMETLFLPLALWRKTRPWIWLGLIAMQAGILVVVDFADLTFGMLMIHLFVFDPRWLPNKITEGSIVFFDGVCGLCNASVDFLIQEDFSNKLRYSPLQGEAVKKFDIALNPKNFDTLYVWTGKKMLAKSAAWLWLASRLGGLWFLISLPMRLIPEFILNLFYDVIATNRYKIFGQRETCRLPTPSERKLFLD